MDFFDLSRTFIPSLSLHHYPAMSHKDEENRKDVEGEFEHLLEQVGGWGTYQALTSLTKLGHRKR